MADAAATRAGCPGSTTATPAVRIVQLQPDGLGVARIGDDVDQALANLKAALGEPDDAGLVAPSTCSGTPSRTAIWGDLAVSFAQEPGDDHLTLWGYNYGSRTWYVGAPLPPAAQPAITSAAGFGLGDHPEPIETLLAQARHDWPTARIGESADPDSGIITATGNGYKLEASTRLATDGWRILHIEVARQATADC